MNHHEKEKLRVGRPTHQREPEARSPTGTTRWQSVLGLQERGGNRLVARVLSTFGHREREENVQAAASISPRASEAPEIVMTAPDDSFEQEARDASTRVVATLPYSLERSMSRGAASVRPVLSTGSSRLQMAREPSDIQRPASVPEIVHRVLRAPGQPLAQPIRGFMESRLHSGFGGVRIHADATSNEAATAVGARAFTVGDDIVFNAREYAPHSPSGFMLLAHELVHTVQQRGTSRRRPTLQRDTQIMGGSLLPPGMGPFSSALEIATGGIGLVLGRSLSPGERGTLAAVYGPFLNYAVIRICERGVCSPDGIPRTIGNLIAAPPGGLSTGTLVHEAAHVWQHQNGVRFAYIPSALGAQLAATIITGSRSAAYDWHLYYDNHIPWMVWNAEAQAAYIEHHMALPPWYVWGTGGVLPVP